MFYSPIFNSKHSRAFRWKTGLGRHSSHTPFGNFISNDLTRTTADSDLIANIVDLRSELVTTKNDAGSTLARSDEREDTVDGRFGTRCGGGLNVVRGRRWAGVLVLTLARAPYA